MQGVGEGGSIAKINGQPLVNMYSGAAWIKKQQNQQRANTDLAGLGVNKPTNQDYMTYYANYINGEGGGAAPTAPYQPQPRYQPSNAGSGSRGGGGGGGGGGATPLSQAAIDWATQLSQGMRPQNQTATQYTAPQYGTYQGAAFDPSTFNDLRTRLAGAGQQDAATAQGATNAMDAYLKNNYQNAFANLPQQTQVGQGLGDLQRLLQGQGVDPSVMAGAAQGMASANQGFQNLWSTLGANEDRRQSNALATNQMTGNDVQNRLRNALMGANTGIDMQQGQARTAYDQQQEAMRRQDWQTQQDLAQQTALANWQRGNQVGDTNTSNTNSFNNNLLQYWLGLMGQTGDATMPTAAQLGIPMV